MAENESSQYDPVKAYRERIAAKGVKSDSVKSYDDTKSDARSRK